MNRWKFHSITHSHSSDWLLFKIAQRTRNTSSVTSAMRQKGHNQAIMKVKRSQFSVMNDTVTCERQKQSQYCEQQLCS